MLKIILYIVAIVAANIITASTMPLSLGVLIVPYGTFFIGATFILRDLVQMEFGRKNSYYVICTALLLSAVASYLMGDMLTIVLASAISFAISESLDTEIFTRLKAKVSARVAWSGTVGSLFDSFIFAVVGLIPAGIITWEALPMAIFGQIVVKLVMQFIAAAFIAKRS